MADSEVFKKIVDDGYAFKGTSFRLGVAMLDGKVVPQTFISIPLKTLNRHGLIAGATGTGSTGDKSMPVQCF